MAALVANGTLDAQVAGTLWAAADEQLSFLTVAVPREAGKTTVASAILGLRRPDVPLHPVLAEPGELEGLRRERRGGYVVVGEFSPWRMPSYIWGDAVRDVFATLGHGYSLQTSLHAPGVEPAIRVISAENRVPDEQASHLKLVVYIEVTRGTNGQPRRRVAEVFELDRVADGKPVGRTLHRWQPADDRFETVSAPEQFGRDRNVLQRRREAIAELVEARRTSVEDVAALVERFA
jgi:hypothetical protein